MKTLSFAPALLVVLGFTRAAHAQTPTRDPAQAEALYKRGVELLEANDWKGACQRLETSMQLDPAASTQILVGRCLAHDGKLARAWYAFRESERLNADLTKGAEKREKLAAYAKAQLRELEPKVPKLTFAVEPRPNGLVVTNDGTRLAFIDDPVMVDVGTHEVVAKAPGFAATTVAVTVKEGETREVRLALKAAPAESPPLALETSAASRSPATPTQGGPTPNPASPTIGTAPYGEAPVDPSSAKRTAGFSLIALGSAGLATSGLFAILTQLKANDLVACNNDPACTRADQEALYETAKHRQVGTFVTLGVGAALAGTGTALVLTSPRAGDALKAALIATPSSLGVRVLW